MKNLKITFSLILAILSSNILAQQTGLFTSSVSWTNSDGSQTRSMSVYVPTSYSASNSYSLVIGFHGQGDSPSNYIQNSKIMGFATDPYFGNVIVVCPEEGPQPAWFYGDEDFGILKAIKEELNLTYNINLNEVFAQGFSFGGKSAFLHGLEEADEIKGIIAYSPAFYGDEDVNNNCSSANCNTAHHDFNYSNSNKVYVCTSAGQLYNGYGEGYMTPLASGDQPGSTWEDSFLGLAKVSKDKINATGGDAIFLESTNTGHSIAPISISKQCWDHVNQSVSTVGLAEFEKAIKFTLYPNPSTGLFNVNFGIDQMETLQIYDMQGREIKRYTKNDYSQNEINIDLSSVKNGIYLLNIVTQGGDVISEKIKILK